MSEETIDQEVIVPAGHGRGVTLAAGALLTVVQTTGHQVADMLAFCRDDLTEFLSTNHTLASNGRLWPAVGQRYLSNQRTPLLEVVDDPVDRHDLIIAACDPWRYRYDFGVEDHRSCSDNFLEVFQPYGIERYRLPHPVNLFQNMLYHEDGQVEFRTSLAGAGASVTLRALVPLLVGVSACPMDLNPISGGRPSDVILRVTNP